MTLQEFEQKYLGQGIDYDQWYGDQCADEMNQYLVDVCGITNPIQVFPGATAYEIYQNANDSRFEKIANTPTAVPQPGDIIFWDTSIGSAGHVAIFLRGDVNNFTSLDQNWPTDSKVHEQDHDYSGVVGWLHLKAQEPMATITQKELDQMRTDRDTNYNNYQAALKKNETLQDQLNILQGKLDQDEQNILSLTSQLATCTQTPVSPEVKLAVTTPQSPSTTESLQKALDQAKPTLKIIVLDWLDKLISHIKNVWNGQK